jgi:hypothetical protein
MNVCIQLTTELLIMRNEPVTMQACKPEEKQKEDPNNAL